MINDLAQDKTREKKIFLSRLTAIFSQLLALATPLITVKVSLEYLGSDIYGIWMAATSLFALIAFADLGLGSGLQSKISSNKNRDIGNLIFNSYIIIFIISMFFICSFLLIDLFIDWTSLLNSNNALTGDIILALVIPKLVGISAGLIRRIQGGLQNLYITNMWLCLSSITNLLSIYIIIYFDFGILTLIFFTSVTPVIVDILNSICFFYKKGDVFFKVKYYLDKIEIKNLLSVGFNFFMLSLFISIGINMDNFIVGKIAGMEEVTSYSIILRITQLINVAVIILSQPLWGAFGDALQKGSNQWVRKITLKTSILSLFICLLSSLVIFAFGNDLIILWLGRDLNLSNFLLIGLLIMQLLLAFISPFFMVLNGAGKIRFQIFLFLIFSPIAFVLKYCLGKIYGFEVIPYVGSILYLLIIVIPVTYFVVKNIFLYKGNSVNV